MCDKESMDYEMKVLKVLNATNNPTIENQGIPRVYFHGPFLKVYNTIVMTLFDGTLEDRYEHHREQLTYSNILTIFKRAVGR